MKQKLTNLPNHIIKVSKYMYRDSKTGNLIHVSKLGSYCPTTQENAELKHERVMQARWDLNRD